MSTQTSTLIKLADIAPGMTFDNGNALHAPIFDWHALLTVVRRDSNAYGCSRFTVSDSNGRHGYAFYA